VTETCFSALSALHAAAFAGVERRWSADEIEALAGARGGVLVVSEDEGFALARVAADEAELLTLAVAPARRRRGVGAALLSMVEARARSAGAAALFLEARADNQAALALYRSRNFDLVARRPRYYAGDTPVDALVMRKLL
jgi:ribosomal-protein-alanine N-acetyltransferase